MTMDLSGVTCPGCNKGTINYVGRAGRTLKVKDLPHEVLIPSSVLLPTCSNPECQEEYVGKEEGEALDCILKTAREEIAKCHAHRVYIKTGELDRPTLAWACAFCGW